MARNSSGTYTRLANSFSGPVAGSTIDANAAEAYFDDNEAEITDSYSRSIKGGMLADGTAATPAFTWSSDLNTGVYRIGDDNIGVGVGGVKILDVASTGLSVTGTVSSTGTFTSAAVASTGALSGAGSFTLSGDITPTALSGNVDDYAPTGFSTATLLRIGGGAADRDITGLAGGGDGLIKVIINIGATNNLILKNATTSSAANQFKFGADITLTPDQGALLWYDSTSSKWRALAVFTTAGGGAGTVTSVAGGAGLQGGTITTSGTLSTGTGSRISNLGLAVSAAASALTIALKGADGNDPSASNSVDIDFRNVTGTTGTPSTLQVQAATSLVISSGSTLGVTSTTAFRLWVVGFNDGSTFRLGVINCSVANSVSALSEHLLVSSTAEGGAGAADSAGVFYTGTAVTSKAYRILGFLEWSASGLTAGTWTTSNLIKAQIYGAGVPKPGEIIQAQQATSSTEFTTTSATYQTSNVSVAITPTSAANFIRVGATAGLRTDASTSAAVARIHRGSTAIGGECIAFSAGGATVGIASFAPWYDNVNSASSTTYSIKLKANNAGTAVYIPQSGGGFAGTIIAEEIMT